TVFPKNRDRFLEGEVAAQFFQAVLGQPAVRVLLSDEHFSVDGTLIEAWASMKSFKPKAVAGGEPPALANSASAPQSARPPWRPMTWIRPHWKSALGSIPASRPS